MPHLLRLNAQVVASTAWTRRSIAFAAGLASVLAFAPFFLWPILFLTFPVLVWLVDGSEKAGAAFESGWWWGFGFFAAGLFWIGEAFLVEAEKFAWALPFAVTLMPAGLALFYGAAAAVAWALWRPGLARLLVLAVVIAVAEWLRGHVFTGFPWNVLGYALTYPDTLMQSAALTGVYGLTLWAVVIFAAPLCMAADGASKDGSTRKAMAGLAIAGVPLALLAVYGALRLAERATPTIEGAKVRIVQPSVPQREKWLPDKQRDIFALHLDLSRTNAAGTRDDLAGITHVLWPEAAMPFRPLEHAEALEAIGELLPAGTYLMSGSLRVSRSESRAENDSAPLNAYNSLLVFGDTGGLAAIYDKIHLVPFGEYLPFQPVLERIGLQQLTKMRGGFSSGASPRPLLDVAGLPRIGALICYEAIFPGEVVQGAERPGLLINVTNDGWFGDTTGPRQHLHQARVRAVEEGLPLLRAANNGVSAVIDPFGRVLDRLDLNVRSVIDTAVPGSLSPPPYASFGDWMFLLNAFVFIGLAMALARRWR